MEVEVLSPHQQYQDEAPNQRFVHVQAPGIIGAALAVLTMLAAFGFGFMMLFGATVLAAALAYIAWPMIFSSTFTQWVFGAPQVQFWKLFALFLAANVIVKMFRRVSWQRK